MIVPPDLPLRTIVATDCGSTTTKAILIEKRGDEYRLVVRGEAPTTVEAPFDDVTVGVTNAVREVEELSGKRLLEEGRVLTERRDDRTGTDLYLSTSSAGGGLQMTVAGVMKSMSAESARLTLIGDMSDRNALARLKIHDPFAASGGLTGMTRRLLGLADLCL